MASLSSFYDVIILGAGAAGLMCAARAGQRGRSVLLLDHADKVGKKILISGGGRCNFTNQDARAACYLSANPHFAKSALGRYQPQNFIDLVNRYGIAWHEKTLGQLFCDGSAKQIVDMLMNECREGKVTFGVEILVEHVQYQDGGFTLSWGAKQVKSKALVVATGGPSIPKMGATGFAYDVARQFKMKVVEPRPALVPFTLGNEDQLFRDLSGVATQVIVTVGKTSFKEAALFTHKGLSGPAMLQISSYWQKGDPLYVDFLPSHTDDFLLAAKREKPKTPAHTALNKILPERLAEALLSRLKVDGTLGGMSDKKLLQVGQSLKHWAFQPTGTEGFAKAEVTVGGVSTAELSSKTMESKKQQGLYFIGEGVDVTGWLGGYNFQWAWASAVAAGDAL